jgi:hypothetical protein
MRWFSTFFLWRAIDWIEQKFALLQELDGMSLHIAMHEEIEHALE